MSESRCGWAVHHTVFTDCLSTRDEKLLDSHHRPFDSQGFFLPEHAAELRAGRVDSIQMAYFGLTQESYHQATFGGVTFLVTRLYCWVHLWWGSYATPPPGLRRSQRDSAPTP